MIQLKFVLHVMNMAIFGKNLVIIAQNIIKMAVPNVNIKVINTL